MAAPSLAQQIEAVDTAIFNIMNGGAVKSYQIGDRNVQKMSLTELMQWRDRLKAEHANSALPGGAVNYASFQNPS